MEDEIKNEIRKKIEEYKKTVMLEFEEDVNTIIENLERETGRRFASSWDFQTQMNQIVPVVVIDNKIIFGDPLTEGELKKIAPITYSVYKAIKQMRKEEKPISKDYYVIKIGDIIFGGKTPRRGRYSSKEKAVADLISITFSELWNYERATERLRKFGVGTIWRPIKLLHYKTENSPPETIISLDSYEEALRFVGKEAYEEYKTKVLERE